MKKLDVKKLIKEVEQIRKELLKNYPDRFDGEECCPCAKHKRIESTGDALYKCEKCGEYFIKGRIIKIK